MRPALLVVVSVLCLAVPAASLDAAFAGEPVATASAKKKKKKKKSSSCHASYKDACLKPNAGDYDCEGGSGDGPNYTGRVRVVGDDVFDLDRDGDGVGCD